MTPQKMIVSSVIGEFKENQNKLNFRDAVLARERLHDTNPLEVTDTLLAEHKLVEANDATDRTLPEQFYDPIGLKTYHLRSKSARAAHPLLRRAIPELTHHQVDLFLELFNFILEATGNPHAGEYETRLKRIEFEAFLRHRLRGNTRERRLLGDWTAARVKDDFADKLKTAQSPMLVVVETLAEDVKVVHVSQLQFIDELRLARLNNVFSGGDEPEVLAERQSAKHRKGRSSKDHGFASGTLVDVQADGLVTHAWDEIANDDQIAEFLEDGEMTFHAFCLIQVHYCDAHALQYKMSVWDPATFARHYDWVTPLCRATLHFDDCCAGCSDPAPVPADTGVFCSCMIPPAPRQENET